MVVIGSTDILKEGMSKIDAASVFDAAATSGTTSVSATLEARPPIITMNRPENKTYENNESIPLKITVVNSSSLSVDKVFYTIDEEVNISLVMDNNGTNQTTIDAPFGYHAIKVFANNTGNEMGVSMKFFAVNGSIRFEVNASIFDGSTTNFNLFNETELQNVTNLTLEDTSFGKIQFLQNINLSDFNLSDSPIDFDSFVVIENNTIRINETVFTNLEGIAAALNFYNITFSNPQVLRNGDACPATICTSQTLNEQTLAVIVSGFSQYEVSESVSGGSGGSSDDGLGGGGGGGGQKGTATIASFDMNQFVEQTNTVARIGKIYILWGKEEYSARVGKPSADTVLLDFAVLGIKVNLGKGQGVSLDLDFDGEEDIKILLEDINQNMITITVTKLQREEKRQKIIEKIPEEPAKEKTREKERSNITKALLNKDLWGVVFLLALMVAFVVYKYMTGSKDRAKRKKHF